MFSIWKNKRKLALALILVLSFCIFNLNRETVLSQDQSIELEILQLNKQIQSQKKLLDEIINKQKEYSQAIESKQKERNTLNSQLELLEDKIAKLGLEIEETDLKIIRTDLELKKISLDILDLNSRIEGQKDHISKLLRLLDKQNRSSTLEILLLNNSLSEFLNQIKYLEGTNEELRHSLLELKNDKNRLDLSLVETKKKRIDLDSLKEELTEKKAQLNYEQSHKNHLLDETKLSEASYQQLLADAKREFAQAEAEISSLERVMRDKLANSDVNRLPGSDSAISWPVPGRHITAYFHDPDYPFSRIIGEHPAIDIRSAQGSPIYAAADAYVARVKFDGSTDYSYIMLIHDKGLSTVYGHVSGVTVETDQYVFKGQQIGYSGGAPGRPGSGPFSTGPHLHFELRLNGLPINPLDYLP